MSEQDRWLLPEGIEEVLPEVAQRLEALRRQALDLFACWGYELVMPPLIEYLDSLLIGVGKEFDLQTFKFTDQVTGRLMGVRPDITPQAARIDAHYLKRSGPVRLCYVGPVLRTLPDEFAGSREPLQLGAELFGHSGPASDAEVLALMVATLELCGITNAHIDLGHVGVFRGLAAEAGLDKDQEAALFEAVQRKARFEVEQILSAWKVQAELKPMLAALIDLNGDDSVLAQARTSLAAAPNVVKQALDDLSEVVELVRQQRPDLALYFDLAELSGYGYHTGVVFSAFVPGHGRAVANGGRYDGIGRAFGRARSATGFGADLRQIVRLLPTEPAKPKGILAPVDSDTALIKEIVRLRTAGERVVQALPGQAATELGCDRVLTKQGKQWKLKKL